jgi:hypothetical protein
VCAPPWTLEWRVAPMMIALWILAAGEAVWASQGIAAAAERDVPADSTKPLVCETPDEVETGQPFVVRCAAAPRDKAIGGWRPLPTRVRHVTDPPHLLALPP